MGKRRLLPNKSPEGGAGRGGDGGGGGKGGVKWKWNKEEKIREEKSHRNKKHI